MADNRICNECKKLFYYKPLSNCSELHRNTYERRRKNVRNWWNNKTEEERKNLYKSRYDYYSNYRLNLKKEIMLHYSDGEIKCKKCGFTDIRALTIDHINGKGHLHRQSLLKGEKGGNNFYLWLKRNSYPLGYQTLCMNCQFIKRFENEELN